MSEDKARQQAENEKANGERLENPDAVRAAEKRLAALGERTTAPVDAAPPKSRQSKRG